MRNPHRHLMFALALFAAGALVPAHAEGPDCPRTAAAPAAAPKPAPKATTAAAESEKKEGWRRWRLEAL